jgi:hypothetical protein
MTMTWNTIRRLMAIVLLGSGIQGFGAIAFVGTVSARPLIDPARFVLHGSGSFVKSEATAIVSRISNDQFNISLSASHVPALNMLHVAIARHVYVAWFVNGNALHGPGRMGAIALVFQRASGQYVGTGLVAVRNVTSVMVTAEPMFQPVMPSLTVLESTDSRT